MVEFHISFYFLTKSLLYCLLLPLWIKCSKVALPMCRYFANNIKSSQIYICIFAVSPLQTLLLLFQLRIQKVFRIVDLSVNVYELKNLPIVLFFFANNN